MPKPARSDEPEVNQFQMDSKAQITKFEQKSFDIKSFKWVFIMSYG